MYSPLIKAFNYALDKLAKFDGPGLPAFQETRQIVFACSAAKCIESESYLQGSFKPDIILVKWDTFERAHQYTGIGYSQSYESDICCDSGCDHPRLSWRNLLSTLEVKRGTGGKGLSRGGNFVKLMYDGDFSELKGDREMVRSSQHSQSMSPKAVGEINSTRSCTSIAFFFLHILISLSSDAL